MNDNIGRLHASLRSSASVFDQAFALGAASAFACVKDAVIRDRIRADVNATFDTFEAEAEEEAKRMVIEIPEQVLDTMLKPQRVAAEESISEGETALGLAFIEVGIATTRARFTAYRARLLAEADG